MKKAVKIIPTAILLLFSSSQELFARISNPVLPPELGQGTDYGGGVAIIIANAWKASLTVGSLFFIIYFAWGALRWMTAEGDKGKFEEGRNKMANGLIGLVILAASQAIIQFAGSVLNIPFLETLSFNLPSLL